MTVINSIIILWGISSVTKPVSFIPPPATATGKTHIKRELSALSKEPNRKPKTWTKKIKALLLAGLAAFHEYTERLLVNVMGVTHKIYFEWTKDVTILRLRNQWLKGELA